MHSLDLCRKVPTHNAILKVSDGLFTSKDPITDTDYRNLSHLFDQLQSAFNLITRFMSEESELNEDRAELEGIPGDSLKSSIVKSIADYTNYGASIGPSPTSSSYKSRKGLADAFNTFSENASLSAAKNLQFMLANSVRVFELTYDQLNAVDRALGGSAGGSPFQISLDKGIFKRYFGKYVVYGPEGYPVPEHAIFTLKNIISDSVLANTSRDYRDAKIALAQMIEQHVSPTRITAMRNFVNNMLLYYNRMAKEFTIAHELAHLQQYMDTKYHNVAENGYGELTYQARLPEMSPAAEVQANTVAINGLLSAWEGQANTPEDIGKVLHMTAEHPLFSNSPLTQDTYVKSYQTHVARASGQESLYKHNYDGLDRSLANNLDTIDIVVERARQIVMSRNLPCVEVPASDNYIRWSAAGDFIKPEIAWRISSGGSAQADGDMFGLWAGSFMRLGFIRDYAISQNRDLNHWLDTHIIIPIRSGLSAANVSANSV